MRNFLWYGFLVVVGLFALVGVLFVAVFVGMRFGIFNVRGSSLERNAFFMPNQNSTVLAEDVPDCLDASLKACDWKATPQWVAIKGGLIKDQEVIAKVSMQTGVSPRMIAATAVPEQMRFFTAEREVFKRYFEPLKILGSLTQFSLGVSGIKQETAEQIELHAASTTSPFYPGAGMAALITYQTDVDHDTELYNRLTNAKDHYYSYLYTALYIKEIEAQWSRAGFSIKSSPGTVVTLFNIGFQNSRPHAAPAVGGATIVVGGTSYTYGQLGESFYNSDELTDVFPK